MKVLVLAVSLGLWGCSSRDTEVRIYTTPKSLLPRANEVYSPKADLNFNWTTPEGWIPVPGKAADLSVRAVQFKIGSGKLSGEASITELPGQAGGQAANVNRWRRQAGLDAQSVEEIQKNSFPVRGAGGVYRLYKIQNRGNRGNSILAAIFERRERTIFVKLVGRTQLIQSEAQRFLSLCDSLRFADD